MAMTDRIRGFLRGALLLCVASTSACLTPPVMLSAVAPDLARALPEYPPGTERVELTTPDGATLRGVFTPAGEGAPVVLHLLGAAQSPASLAQPLDGAAWAFADIGYASLLCDYRGIGASPGEDDVDRLGDDALCMWNEAVRRAGGDPSRVVVRATSLGTISTALILRAGARPAAVLLLAPVFPDTVVERFASDNYGRLAGWLASALFRPVARVDVFEQLERLRAPLCVSLFEDDHWSTKRDLARLFAAVRKAPSHSWRLFGGDHVGGVLFTSALSSDERQFARQLDLGAERFARSAEQARRELCVDARGQLVAEQGAAERFTTLAGDFGRVPADHLAAAALEHDDLEHARVWIHALRGLPPAPRAFEQLRALYSPKGDDPELLTSMLGLFAISGGEPVRRGSATDLTFWDEPVGIESNLAGLSRQTPTVVRRLFPSGGRGTATMRWTPAWTEVNYRSDVHYRRVVARAALKYAGFADRVLTEASGEPRLEYFRDGAWRPLAIPAEHGP